MSLLGFPREPERRHDARTLAPAADLRVPDDERAVGIKRPSRDVGQPAPAVGVRGVGTDEQHAAARRRTRIPDQTLPTHDVLVPALGPVERESRLALGGRADSGDGKETDLAGSDSQNGLLKRGSRRPVSSVGQPASTGHRACKQGRPGLRNRLCACRCGHSVDRLRSMGHEIEGHQ